MKSFIDYLLLYEIDPGDPRLVKKYTEKPAPGLSARKPTVTTGKVSATKHTGPTAVTSTSSGTDRALHKLRASRFAAAAASKRNTAALKKRAAILTKPRPAKIRPS